MKSPGRYLVSLVLSVVMVFVTLAAAFSIILTVNITSEKFCKMSEKEMLPSLVMEQIKKYYTDKYYTSGIPAEVYTDAVTVDDVAAEIDRNIVSGFYTMEKGGSESSQLTIPELEKSLSDFLDNYAAENDFTDTEKLEAKKQSVISAAYKTISSQCDVFRFGSLKEHGVLGKLTRVYTHRRVIVMSLMCISMLIFVLLLAVNHKEKPAALYWSGISEIIAGLFLIISAAGIMSSDKIHSFTIKQEQIYTAYISTFLTLTQAVFAAGFALFVLGIAFVILYKVFSTRDESVEPTKPMPING